MKKRWIVWTIALAAIAGLSVFAVLWLQPPTWDRVTDKDMAEFVRKQYGVNAFPTPTTVAPIDLKRPIRLAVGGLGRSDDEQNRELEDLTLTDLTGAPGLELVERQSLDKVLRELNLGLSHLVRAQDAVRVGKLLKVDWFLLGTMANISGTNFIVARLVDSHTGIMRDAAIFSTDGSPVKLATDIAGFVRQCRQDAANPRPRVFLAIGTFRDLSLNNRQATFPAQLRGYLTAAYQGTNVTLLEREAADVLLREVQLDLAGLTEGGGTNPPQLLQSAYWFVDGDYQSYETTNLEVEVALWINRIFGRGSWVTVRGPPDGRLFAKIKDLIDMKMKRDASPLVLSGASEARAQMMVGKELAGVKFLDTPVGMIDTTSYYQERDEQEFRQYRRNTEEAIRAFETVLLLEPTNRQAKMYLAGCLRQPVIGRVDEARDLYREIIEAPVQDEWSPTAKEDLVNSFQWSSAEEKARWFGRALRGNTNSALDEFYRQHAETADRDAAIASGDGDITKLAEQRLLEAIQSTKNTLEGKAGTDGSSFGLDDFPGAFQDKAVAIRKMMEFLPQMESKFPELAPHLTAAVLTFQTDTNSPVVAEFQKQLEWCQGHPKELYKPERFWSYSGDAVFRWLYDHKLYQLALQTMEGWQAAADQKITASDSFADEKRVALGYAYMKVGQWRSAMGIFDSFSNMPVLLNGDWPWGNFNVPVLTGVEAGHCRKKLGLPVVRDPREFEMDKATIQLCSCSAFAVDGDGVWIGINDRLIHLDFNLETNSEVILPKDDSTPVTAICVNALQLWIGTGGDGLIEFNKVTRECRRFTVQDGLMMNEISCAQLSGNRLWIGYGHPGQPGVVNLAGAGGIGFLNLLSRQFVSFTPSLTNGTDALKYTSGNVYVESSGQPPRRGITALAAGTSGNVWFLTEESGLRHFQQTSNTWDALYSLRNGCCLAAEAEALYAGVFDFVSGKCKPGPPGLIIFNSRNGQWRSLTTVPELSADAITAITPDDGKVWVGGTGYIALVDPHLDKLCKFTRIRSRTVDRIQIGGGYVWVQYDSHLHRALLSSLQ